MFLYHLRFTSVDEEFEKIGITKNTPHERFGVDTYRNYNVYVINLIELPDDECKQLEKTLLKEFKEYKYVPLDESFVGKTECFYPDCVNIEIR